MINRAALFSTLVLGIGALAAPLAAQDAAGPPLMTIKPLPGDGSVQALKHALAAHETTSAELVSHYQAAIARHDRAGAQLGSIIALDPGAGAQARARDAERRGGALWGVPILLKDNIETADLPTTAGSLALKDNANGRDAPVAARLTAAGAVILGKTNLSEWANYRSTASISGWSGVGGQARNAYDPLRSPCGSSSGSGAAVAAGFAAAAIGTETDGSITCPASANGLVGLKPTVGLVSRTHIVPISHSQDTAGPMTLTVADAALILSVIAGTDPADPATAAADAHKTDYVAALDAGALKGARIGVMRFSAGFHRETDVAFEQALAALTAAGAVLVEIKDGPDEKAIGAAEGLVLRTEFKADLNAYLASTSPERVKTRSLADLIAFNREHADQEMPLFGQELFEASEATGGLSDPAYLEALALGRRLAGPEGIDRMLNDDDLIALVAPTLAPAGFIDPILKDRYISGEAGSLAAVAGYPHLTVPMGLIRGMPVGLSFIGPAWSEARLLSLGYAYEQATHARRPPAIAP